MVAWRVHVDLDCSSRLYKWQEYSFLVTALMDKMSVIAIEISGLASVKSIRETSFELARLSVIPLVIRASSAVVPLTAADDPDGIGITSEQMQNAFPPRVPANTTN